MRCDEFYEKWRRCGNFCEKHPDTAREIDKLLDFIDEHPDLSVLSAKAVRPLIREKDEEVRDKAIESVKKSLESKKNPVTGRFTNKPPTNRDVVAVIETIKEEAKPVPHVSHNGGDNEWYTPEKYVVAARSVMGSIDLDPASTEEANAVVGATRFYTAEQDGLKQAWVGNVWMNPPYASNLIGEFITKLCDEFKRENVSQACVLVNNATETRWFQEITNLASGIMFPKGRVRFWHPRKESAPLQGQALIYLGHNTESFYKEFSAFGVLCNVVH